MYAVIFRAKAGEVDNEYGVMAGKLRDMAMTSFGCLDFVSVSENGNEIAISYWPDQESIHKWKAHSEHVLAQEMGRKKWYESYLVQIAEIKREYRFNE